jgi:hypothetical protein
MVLAPAWFMGGIAFQFPDQVLASVVNQQARAAIRPDFEPLPY